MVGSLYKYTKTIESYALISSFIEQELFHNAVIKAFTKHIFIYIEYILIYS